MTGKSRSAWPLIILLVLGIGAFVGRLNLNIETGDSNYRLTYAIEFHARKPDGRAIVTPESHLLAAFPESTRFCRVLDQDIDHPDMDVVQHRVHNAASRKDIVLRTARPGQHKCTISFRVSVDPNGEQHVAAEAPPTPKDRSMYLSNAKGMTVNSDTAVETVNRLRDNHPGRQELADRIFAECNRTIEPEGDLGVDSGDETLLHQKGSPLGRARAFATLCRAAKIPARLVTGFQIKKESKQEIHPRTWVEVYVPDPKKSSVERWVPYDLESGAEHALDYDYLPVRRGGVDLVRVSNATDLTTSYSIESIPPLPRTVLGVFNLHGLPAKLHEPIKVVLILPIGALFTAFVRTIIGLRTFGTFSPTLLALAFVYNDWRSGLCIFLVVIATGFISRTLLDRLKLLLVPRLGIILTLVVMLMVLGISVMNHYDWGPTGDQAGKTVLLPMVILTNLVERFYVTSEEDSFFQAVRLLVATMFMALAIYLLLSSPSLGGLLFNYPELHFFTVAALVLMGYTGYRLTELLRFRDLVHPSRDPLSGPPDFPA